MEQKPERKQARLLGNKLGNVDIDGRVERHEDTAMVLALLKITEKFINVFPRDEAVGKILHLKHKNLI